MLGLGSGVGEMYGPTISQRTYMHDMTPMKSTRKDIPQLCLRNSNVGRGTYEEAECNTLSNEPKQYNQTTHPKDESPGPSQTSHQHLTNSTITAGDLQPIPPRPPKRKQKERGENNRSDFTRVGVEPACDECCADER